MAKNLSFSIAINLLTENFKRGTNQVKAAFRSMQMQILTFAAALGAGGLGLSNFVSRLIEVARETNRVTTALKNVSGSTSQYADNQRYLLDLAKKYGLEINALTANYAKFTAAASISGMSMMNQRKIFESVSRACTAFGMSADDSNGVMLALSQMMSKGKISSEELRLQMGERLPIALQAMAKAAGVSVGGLDKLMKKGKLMSADVLPKFADALNEMIPNVDTDNLETSVNRLKNTFTEFANSLDIQSKYKSLVDGLAGAISGLKGKLSGVVAFIITLISGKLLASVVSYFGQFWKLSDVAIRKVEAAEAQKLAAVQKRIEAEKVYEATLTDYNTKENGKRLASKGQLNKAEKVLDAAKLSEKKTMLAAATAIENAAAVSSTTIWGKTLNTLKLGFIQLGRTIKAVFVSSWPLLLITGIAMVISKIVSMRDEAKRVKNIFSDYKKEIQGVTHTTEIIQLQALLKLYNDSTGNVKLQEQYQKRIEGILGRQIKDNETINGIVAERIKLLEASARIDKATQKKIEYEDKNTTIKNELGINDKDFQNILTERSRGNYDTAIRLSGGVDDLDYSRLREINEKVYEFMQNFKVISDTEKVLEDNMKYVVKNETNSPTLPPDDNDKDKKSPIQKAEEEYAESLQTYKNQLAAGAITQEKYNEEVDDLNKNTVSKIGGILGKSADANKTYADALKGTLNPLVTDEAKAKIELTKVEKEYNDNLELAKAKLDRKLISEDDYTKAIIDAATSAAESAISIKNIGTAADGFINKVQGVAIEKIEANIKAPVLGKRDITFDYKATESDKISGELDIWEKYRDQLEKLKEENKGLSKDLQEKLNYAIAHTDDLGNALKLAEVQEDIKNLSEEISNLSWDGFKGAVSSIDGVVSAFQRLQDAFDPDQEATEWERLMAIWNSITSVVDGILSVMETIKNITELTNKLTEAKKTEAAIDTTTTATKITNATTGAAATLAASAVEKTAATGEVAANTAKGVSAAGASAAKLPFPANIIAIGGAIAAAVALFAAIPKFASGGVITGGPTSGDKILARVNAGEMILNQGQQSNLFKAINSGNLGNNSASSLSVTSKVRAKDLILIINNELKSQGKKTIS